jgi:gluconolactonase
MEVTVHEPLVLQVLGTGLGYTEGPVVGVDGTVHAVDLSENRIWRLDGGEPAVAARVEGCPNGMALLTATTAVVANNGGFPWTDIGGVRHPIDVAAHTNEPPDFGGGWLEQVDLATGEVTRLLGGPTYRGPNDLVVDESGGIWFTDTGKFRRKDVDHGSVHYVCPDGTVEPRLFPLLGPNGIGLSPAGDRLYVSETLTGRLWAWEIGEPGEVRRSSTGDPFHGGTCVAATPHTLDSLAVEADGRVAIGAISDGVVVITPDGSELDIHPVPGDVVTNIAFGGSDGRRAVLTLARSGSVVETTWPRPGLVLPGRTGAR